MKIKKKTIISLDVGSCQNWLTVCDPKWLFKDPVASFRADHLKSVII